MILIILIVSYLRPTTAPSAGNIATAEKTFAELGYCERDLERFFLGANQIPASAVLWSPKSKNAHQTSNPKTDKTENLVKLFSHLVPKELLMTDVGFIDAPIRDISFRKFVLKVLPEAASISTILKDEFQPFFLTTGHEGTKPIMSIHRKGSHSACWYTRHKAITPANANLKSGVPISITQIISFPHMWDHFLHPIDALDEHKVEAFPHKRNDIRYLFVLDGAKDTQNNSGLALFPTLMKSEFHGVRSTVESFNRSRKLGEVPMEMGSAVGGLIVAKEGSPKFVVKVRNMEVQVSRYRIALFE